MATNSFEDGVIRPLRVPAEHDPKAPLEERAVYALAYLKSGTARQVAAKLAELGDGDAEEVQVKQILDALFEKGLVNGSDRKRNRTYDLAKVTRPHHGNVEPDRPTK